MTTIIVTSDGAFDSYPGNVPADFRCDFNQKLHFNFNPNQSWEMALSEIFIHPHSCYQIREPFNTFEFCLSNFDIFELDKRLHVTLVGSTSCDAHRSKVWVDS